MIYALELTTHPVDTTRRAFRIVVLEEWPHILAADYYGIYDTHQELMAALEPLLRMEASR